MKLWRITYHDNDSPSGTVQEWFTSKRDAKARVHQIVLDDDSKDFALHDLKQVTVPDTRNRLVTFLNHYAASL